MDKSTILEGIILSLTRSLELKIIDYRTIYRIKGHSGLFGTELFKEVNLIISQIDEWGQDGQTRLALTDVEKLLGLIIGLNEHYASTEVNETISSNDNNTEEDALVPTFKLNKSDKGRVLELCTQMRKIVLATDAFDQPHRRRLLDRIAGIEHQVEQPKGKLDILRAGGSDVGETLGKFGLDIKPLTDRMKEVVEIGRSNSKQYDQIPAPEEIKKITDQSGEVEEE